jgi:hypothetical protein
LQGTEVMNSWVHLTWISERDSHCDQAKEGGNSKREGVHACKEHLCPTPRQMLCPWAYPSPIRNSRAKRCKWLGCIQPTQQCLCSLGWCSRKWWTGLPNGEKPGLEEKSQKSISFYFAWIFSPALYRHWSFNLKN